jgi:hypothetical protein
MPGGFKSCSLKEAIELFDLEEYYNHFPEK